MVHKSPRTLVISLIFADDTKHSFSVFEMVNFIDFCYILSNFEMIWVERVELHQNDRSPSTVNCVLIMGIEIL